MAGDAGGKTGGEPGGAVGGGERGEGVPAGAEEGVVGAGGVEAALRAVEDGGGGFAVAVADAGLYAAATRVVVRLARAVLRCWRGCLAGGGGGGGLDDGMWGCGSCGRRKKRWDGELAPG